MAAMGGVVDHARSAESFGKDTVCVHSILVYLGLIRTSSPSSVETQCACIALQQGKY